MSPAWANRGVGAFPRALQPPSVGLVAWFKGETIAGSGGLADSWPDSTSMGQDMEQPNALYQPTMGIGGDAIDGVPGLTFPLNFDSAKYLFRTANLLDRSSSPIQVGPISIIVVCKPRYSAAAFNITGGPVFSVFNQVVPRNSCLFTLESNFVADGAYGWSRANRDVGSELQFGPITGGVAGPFNNVPTLLEWRNSGFPTIEMLVNNTPVTLTPSTMYGTTGPGAYQGFMCGNVEYDGFGLNFLGSQNEILIYDVNLADDPSKHGRLMAYLRQRYPSLVIA